MKYSSIAKQPRNRRGFTLIELLVVISIIAILTGFITVAVFNGRTQSRDMSRVTDLQQIKLALKLYKDTYGEYPCENASKCTSPVQTETANGHIGEGGHIDTLLAPFMSKVPADPASDSDHYYYYDGNQYCGGNVNQAVVFARTMEEEKFYKNDDTICTSWGGEGGAGQPESYMLVVGKSSDI